MAVWGLSLCPPAGRGARALPWLSEVCGRAGGSGSVGGLALDGPRCAGFGVPLRCNGTVSGLASEGLCTALDLPVLERPRRKRSSRERLPGSPVHQRTFHFCVTSAGRPCQVQVGGEWEGVDTCGPAGTGWLCPKATAKERENGNGAGKAPTTSWCPAATSPRRMHLRRVVRRHGAPPGCNKRVSTAQRPKATPSGAATVRQRWTSVSRWVGRGGQARSE